MLRISQLFIYKITNLLDNKVYIGQTNNPGIRWSNHKSDAKLNKRNYPLYNSMNKYGIDNFKYEAIQICNTQEEADQLEKDLITQYKSQDRNFGYNIAPGGSRVSHSQETKDKLSQQKRKFYQKRLQETGQKITEEERQKLSISHKGQKSANKGKQLSEKQREILRQSHLGRVHSEEEKRKRSESLRLRYQNDPELKERVRQKSIGRYKLTSEQQLEICQLYQNGINSMKLGKQFNVSPTTICGILRRNNLLI